MDGGAGFCVLSTGKGYRGNGEVGNELGSVLGVVGRARNHGRGGLGFGETMVARVVTSMVMVVVLAGGNGDVGDDVYGVEMVVGSGGGVVMELCG
ncbi:hypothetical protein Tco_0222701 [Tanacetum coccineum]